MGDLAASRREPGAVVFLVLMVLIGSSTATAAKFAVRGFTEALRQECLLDGSPVSVSCIHPGGVRTEIARRARATSGEDREELARTFDGLARTSPPRAARTILRGLERDKARILVGPDAWFLAALPRVLGADYGRLVARASARLDR